LNKPEDIPSGVIWHQLDLNDVNQMSERIADIQPTHLLHFAWYTIPGRYCTSLENLSWVRMSLALLEKFASNGGRRMVIAGTCAEYDWKYGYCSEHVTPLMPETLYGTCKHSLQIMTSVFSEQVGLSQAWGRIFFLYGPREHPNRLISSVIRALLLDQPARCTHGNQIRDYLYVEDVGDAFVTLLESGVEGPVNIASGHPIALREIIHKIAKKLDREDLVQLGALTTPPNEVPLLIANVDRIFNEVGWKPKWDLDHGLDETINWWKMSLSKT
jgi:nucleoside-diphosphate-sugar epimerase